ncbi:CopG family transcriptional regulator [Pseudomonas sp. NKUCC02_KPG]|uniref:ribbon-helix-helix domain-containing protein n=1 Tax=Pseudomonas sp. NKUCC02_KPG TaxID=2842124 RepID=UPI0027DB3C8C|nr:CopG family transcriptional regulator [Pseudomonas sp. NKUCC02_KPG]
MTRSPANTDRKTVRTSVMLPEDAHLQVQALADANNVSSAWVIRMAIQRFLTEYKGQLELPLRLSTRPGSDSND